MDEGGIPTGVAMLVSLVSLRLSKLGFSLAISKARHRALQALLH